MTVKQISFKCTKASSYYTIGGVRFYDREGNIYPINFLQKIAQHQMCSILKD